MKSFSLLFITLLLIILCGCANTYNLTEDQQLEAIKKYPRGGLNIEPDDGVFMTTMKITGRVLVCPLTFGISEILLLNDRETTFLKYANYLYFNSFLDKPCAVAIQAFGAPTRVTTDGNNGKIYVWEKIYTTGGETYYYNNRIHSTPLRLHKDIKEFYYTNDNKCYHWRTATE